MADSERKWVSVMCDSVTYTFASHKQDTMKICSACNDFVENTCLKVNIQDFLQVFKGSGIGKIEDNLTSEDPRH